MAEKESKVIQVAERIIEFRTEDIRENPSITYNSEDLISENDWSEFAKNALVIMDGYNIFQYAEEYPIVKYKSNDLANCYYGKDFLNSFVKSITVSTALYGKKASFCTGKLSRENTSDNTVAYYTDRTGINQAILQHDIYCFLLQKPKLVVSPEGVLVFFTDKHIIATINCNDSYYWIDGNVISVGNKTIKDIEVCDEYCKVILLDNEKVEYNFSLKFDFDVSSYQALNPKASEL